ncbi:hypothetical protein IPA_07475 [Ignicoccus pacificus DSM 13166]|uniref:ABC transmembrane type-1 domain-containing protein n=1 Tax=Ignicoccus pacificus DSM 13166 TaxID=940294 RepID=A0A977KBN7_9CREN|nr:hypothetical protein IPA_07475 [Ignicoccus pacificus DSM 13166]
MSGFPRFAFFVFLSLIVQLSPLEIALLVSFLASLAPSKAIHFKARQMREENFFLASLASGASAIQAFIRHVPKNVVDEVLKYSSMIASIAVYAEAGLAMLGLESQGIPSLGKELNLILNTPGALMERIAQIQVLVIVLTIIVISELVRKTATILTKLILPYYNDIS